MCMGIRMWQSSWGRGIPDSILVPLTVLGRGVRGSVCTGFLVSRVLGVFGSLLYGGAVGPRGLLASALGARAPSASCSSPARALAAASVAARAGRCGASRCPLLAVAITIAICLLSGALQRPLPAAAAAAAAPVAVIAAALGSPAAPLLCPTVGRCPAALAALSAAGVIRCFPRRTRSLKRYTRAH